MREKDRRVITGLAAAIAALMVNPKGYPKRWIPKRDWWSRSRREHERFCRFYTRIYIAAVDPVSLIIVKDMLLVRDALTLYPQQSPLVQAMLRKLEICLHPLGKKSVIKYFERKQRAKQSARAA